MVIATAGDGRKAEGTNLADSPLLSDEIIARIKKKKEVKGRATVSHAGGKSYRLLNLEVT
jgi:hypothetical protein